MVEFWIFSFFKSEKRPWLGSFKVIQMAGWMLVPYQMVIRKSLEWPQVIWFVEVLVHRPVKGLSELVEQSSQMKVHELIEVTIEANQPTIDHSRPIYWRWILEADWLCVKSIPTTLYLYWREVWTRCFHIERTNPTTPKGLNCFAQCWLDQKINCNTQEAVKLIWRRIDMFPESPEARFLFLFFDVLTWYDWSIKIFSTQW